MPTPRRIAVFFYGLFMDADLLRQKGADPQDIRKASVTGLELRIGQRAALAEMPGSTVHGVVMTLTHAELSQLYADDSVSVYKPEAVVARQPDGATVPALCYNLEEAPGPDEKNSEYAAKLRDLAKRLELPPDYVASIGS